MKNLVQKISAGQLLWKVSPMRLFKNNSHRILAMSLTPQILRRNMMPMEMLLPVRSKAIKFWLF